ncbi:uncharacterized protein [Diabrotica undecimpunctata]|uniref:uncharacterized protein n=1 Tax=Diabrotica undecimpunctata TaxID=50387 RepID=UPI003B6332CC
MTREDLERTDNERRRKNRWVTDAIFCEDIQMLFVANSTRSVAIYEASGLKHEPYWLIMGVHHIIECLSYKNLYHTQSDTKPKCALFAGTSSGDVVVFKFIQPTNSLLRRKHMDRITLFYWDELKYEKLYLKIQFYKAVHNSNVEQMEYCSIENAVISCSKDPNTSLMKKYMSLNKQPYILKMRKGCNCFSFSTTLNILVTGSDDKTIRVWNSVLASNTIAVFTGHQQKIVDVAIMDNQKTILSFSEDGILKLWEINENKCLQTINIEFPAFNILGKRIEFGRRNIYPGAKRSSKYLRYKDNISLHKKYFGISEVEERPKLDEEIRGIHANKWERSNILLTCCNHIASIRTTFEDNNIEKSNDMSILPSPPLQNSVLIPNCWQIPIAELKENNQCNDETGTELNEELTSIIEKDFFDLGTVKTDINYKIAVLEAKKMQMKAHVASGAPYLALDLTEFEELKLSDNLVIPEKKEIKNTIDKIKKRLEDVSMREKAFSEPSSGRSRKSSRSSVISIM